jgi:clan AA aspartic protease
MRVQTGSFDFNGNPVLKINVSGVHSTASVEVVAIIDTGFSGFLSMPMLQAFPLGLQLAGTTSTILADGQTQNKLIACAKVTIGGIEQVGVVVLEPSSTDILIGMDFLRRFKMGLFISSSRVMLFDDDAFQKAAAQMATSVAKA